MKTFSDEDGQEGHEFQAIGYIVKPHFQHQQQNEQTKKKRRKKQPKVTAGQNLQSKQNDRRVIVSDS